MCGIPSLPELDDRVGTRLGGKLPAVAIRALLDRPATSRYGPAMPNRAAQHSPRRPHRLVAPLLGLVALGASLVAAPQEAEAQSKIAVVDVRRAVLETEEGLRVQATLKKLFDSRQVELDNKQRKLQHEKEELDKQEKAGKTSKDAIDRKFDELQKQAGELQQLIVEYQNEMRRKESELTNPILQKVLGLVRQIAHTDGFEMIIDKATVPYFRSDLEITDRTIQMYNSGTPAAPAGKPAPGKPAAGKPAAPAAKPAAAPPKK
jgi:outer membrane protein